MARKKSEPEAAGGCPAWLATYGDLVTLVLTFFVLLYSFSEIDNQKVMEMIRSFQASTGVFQSGENPTVDHGKNDTELPTMEPVETQSDEQGQGNPQNQTGDMSDVTVENSSNPNYQDVLDTVDALKNYAGTVGVDNIEISHNEFEIIVRLPGNILFDSAHAVLKEESKAILTGFFEIVDNKALGTLDVIRVEGHTDTRPISNARYRDNQDLSTARADTVLRYLWATVPQIPKNVYAASGYGEYRPIDTNDTEEGRAHNRRVDFVLVWPYNYTGEIKGE